MKKELILPRLSRRRAGKLKELACSCISYEGLSLSCPLDGDRFYLLQDEMGGLLSAIAVYREEDFWECYAFTRPGQRRKGYFTRLLRLAQADSRRFPGCRGLLFLSDHKSQDAEGALNALGAQLFRREHAMAMEVEALGGGALGGEVLGGEALGGKAPSQGCGAESLSGKGGCLPFRDKEGSLSLSVSVLDKGQDCAQFKVSASLGQDPAGSCRLCRMGDTACLYCFEILPSLRGQGLGSLFLRALLSKAPALGISSLILQVSADNAPAMSLYKKTGFRVTETLSYWRLPEGNFSFSAPRF